MGLVFLFHLRENGVCHHISRQKLIDKPLTLPVQQDRTLTPHGFGNQEFPSVFFRVQGCGMNLYVVDMLQADVVPQSQRNGIPGQVTIVGGMLEQPADSSGGKNGVVRCDGGLVSVRVMSDDSAAFSFIAEPIYHGIVFDEGDIVSVPRGFQQMGGDFLAGFILMEENPRTGMCAFSGVMICFSVFFKPDAERHQIADHILR